jgi:hypothetical protein
LYGSPTTTTTTTTTTTAAAAAAAATTTTTIIIIRVTKSRKMRWVGHEACMGEIRHAYKILVRKPEGKRPFEKSRHRWDDTVEMELGEVVWEGVDLTLVAQ